MYSFSPVEGADRKDASGRDDLTDCAPAVVGEVRAILDEHGWNAPSGSSEDDSDSAGTVFYCSDTGDTFRRQAERFLDMSIEFVHHVDLEMCEDEEG